MKMYSSLLLYNLTNAWYKNVEFFSLIAKFYTREMTILP